MITRLAPLAMALGMAAGALRADDLEGMVTGIDGDRVIVSLQGDLVPAVGDGALVYYKIQGLDDPIEVCRAKVESVEGREVRLRAEPHEASIKAGQLARISTEHPTVAKEADRPDGKELSGNEVAALAALHQLVTTESVWRQTDADRNGFSDYWTLDVAAFHFRLDANRSTVQLIDINIARADRRGLGAYEKADPSPFHGYWTRSMKSDAKGASYCMDEDGDGKRETSPVGFAFCAWPAEYGKSGRRTLIVNEEGVVYAKDLGSGATEGCDAWPAEDPTTAGWSSPPGELKPGWLGVSFGEAPQSGEAPIFEVVPGSPAAAAGLRPGDILRSLDGMGISSVGSLAELVRAAGAGTSVVLMVRRDGKDMEVTVKLGELPRDDGD